MSCVSAMVKKGKGFKVLERPDCSWATVWCCIGDDMVVFG